MASSKLVASLFLALALVVATTPQPSQAARAEPGCCGTPSPAPSPEASPPEQATASCVSWFLGMTPCMDFFTDASVPAPSSACCRGLESLVDGAAVCLCHAMNGDIDNLMPANTDFTRVSDLPATCGVALPVETLSKCGSESTV
ncbi:non-specific lipid-transfer protein C6-like [Panicum virgatum]|uniref:non-specific lipid-transfer protein C6-like n=1 Tax=Panicum virgatum TaxID=38727 RepID=UPI0019D55AA9|nr:non-specific lipid-transfer protein C6-like [Panicum virgatum]XP_039825307.1 non-specific lipid-transfer protein C6-like [Panicum virgatum]XP_039825315.1 non-specific lipid-transfer protein C6-like [Panicum virgatum]